MSATQVLFTDYLLWRVKLKLLPGPSLSTVSCLSEQLLNFSLILKEFNIRQEICVCVCVVGDVAFFTFFLCYFIPAVYVHIYCDTVTGFPL